MKSQNSDSRSKQDLSFSPNTETVAQLRKGIADASALMRVPVGSRVRMLSTKSGWKKGELGTAIMSNAPAIKRGQIGIMLDDPTRTDFTEHTAFEGDYELVSLPTD